MRRLIQIASKLGAITFLIFASSTSAFATGATVTFSIQSPTGVPSLSGTMLIVLTVLLFIVAFRISKQKGRNGNTFCMGLIAAGIVVSTGTGVKLVSDAYAGTQINIQPGQSTRVFTITPGSDNNFFNDNEAPLNFSLVPGPDSACVYRIRAEMIQLFTYTETTVTGSLLPNNALEIRVCDSIENLDD